VLYGYKLELISDPIVIGPDLVFVDAIESKSGLRKRVRIPLIMLNRAKGNHKPR
jgi:precorrin isomerase